MSTPTPSRSDESPDSETDEDSRLGSETESDADTAAESNTDAPPPNCTTTEIVPVSVPRAVEVEARSRAAQSNEAVEDVLADHVTAVPDYRISPTDGERVPPGPHRRVALHVPVEPALAEAVDALADDRRAWVREAIEEKVRRERGRGTESDAGTSGGDQ